MFSRKKIKETKEILDPFLFLDKEQERHNNCEILVKQLVFALKTQTPLGKAIQEKIEPCTTSFSLYRDDLVKKGVTNEDLTLLNNLIPCTKELEEISDHVLMRVIDWNTRIDIKTFKSKSEKNDFLFFNSHEWE